jgi:protein TonB
MLMALELSGGGTGAGLASGEQSGTGESSLLPLLGDSAASPSPAAGEALPSTPPAPEAKDPAQDLPPAPAQVSAAQKPAPTPIKQTPVEQRPPKQLSPEQTTPEQATPQQARAEQPDHEEKIQNPQQLGAHVVTAELPEEPALDSPGKRAGKSEATALQAGTGNSSQGQGQGSGPGSSGAGVNLGKPGSGGNTHGISGAGSSLVKFGTPGGPGIVRMAQPRYPHEARRLGKEGVVVLKLSLDAAGAVHDVEVLQGVGFGMDEASREAVMLSRFRPATFKGKPVACQVILPIHFKLR